MSKKIKSYDSAYQELQDIMEQIKEGKINVDKLAEKIERASELMEFCKEKLRKTEFKIRSVLK